MANVFNTDINKKSTKRIKKKTMQQAFLITPELKERLEKASERSDLSMNAIITIGTKNYLTQLEKELDADGR